MNFELGQVHQHIIADSAHANLNRSPGTLDLLLRKVLCFDRRWIGIDIQGGEILP
jgi:hypothetical protein